MERLRSRWVRGVLLWTLVLLVVTVVVAIQAIASLYNAQQACFFQPVPCPEGDDPRVVQLGVAFIGLPLVWGAGVVLASIGREVTRRRADRGR